MLITLITAGLRHFRCGGCSGGTGRRCGFFLRFFGKISCGARRREGGFDAFDTVLTIHVVAKSRADAEKISENIHALAMDLHRLFDIYHTYDDIMNLKTVNDRAGDGTAVHVSKDIINLLLLGQDMYDISGGKVNVCMGAVLSIWHTYRTEGTAIPSANELTAAATHTVPSVLVVDETTSTICLNAPDASLDVGAIAKGSGDDQRYYTVDGTRYHHLIDPNTLMPATYHRSVTIIASLAHTETADGLSTAAFLMSLKDGDSMLAKFESIDGIWIEEGK